MNVEWSGPELAGAPSLVLIHGGGGQWAGALGEMGAAPTAEGIAMLFRSPEAAHPTSHLHTQWPGDGGPADGDPAILQLLSGSRPMPTDLSVAHALERRLGAELLDRIGESVLFTHSAGLPHGLTAVAMEGLRGIPVLLVTAEASLLGHFDTEVRDYLIETGLEVELLRLADHGVYGNGHGMIFESNHLEVLEVVMNALNRLL